jgi:mobilome CxxCx(11)CxxC protein
MTVGLLVLSYGHFKSLPTIIAVASALGIGQIVVSLWSVIGGWVAGYSYASDSAAANSGLARRYEELASNPPDDISVLRHEYEKLAIQNEDRESQDYKQSVKESEKHMGMRAALRKYRRECAACGEVPTTMKATSCGVCGKFRYRVR